MISPTNPIAPEKDTASATAAETGTRSATRSRPGLTPTPWAVRSPVERASTSGEQTTSRTVSATATATMVSAVRHVARPSEPSIQNMMAWLASGRPEVKMTRFVTAWRENPTARPANTRRSGLGERPVRPTTMASVPTAPAKAKIPTPVVEEIPRTRSAMVQPAPAPELMPSTYGSASALRATACSTTPDTPSTAPTPSARRLRGKRVVHTMASMLRFHVISMGMPGMWLAITPTTWPRVTSAGPAIMAMKGVASATSPIIATRIQRLAEFVSTEWRGSAELVGTTITLSRKASTANVTRPCGRTPSPLVAAGCGIAGRIQGQVPAPPKHKAGDYFMRKAEHLNYYCKKTIKLVFATGFFGSTLSTEALS